jgi:prevent-host-death family protein
MVEVGARELKNALSAYLRRVADGEHVRVTLRGKPVADLVPTGRSAAADHRRRLVAEGTLTPARAPEPDQPPPLARPLPGLSPSELILAEREQDR